MSKTERRRGRHVLRTFKELKGIFGVPLAKSIREKKKELGGEWWSTHPDLPDSEDPHLNIVLQHKGWVSISGGGGGTMPAVGLRSWFHQFFVISGA